MSTRILSTNQMLQLIRMRRNVPRSHSRSTGTFSINEVVAGPSSRQTGTWGFPGTKQNAATAKGLADGGEPLNDTDAEVTESDQENSGKEPDSPDQVAGNNTDGDTLPSKTMKLSNTIVSDMYC